MQLGLIGLPEDIKAQEESKMLTIRHTLISSLALLFVVGLFSMVYNHGLVSTRTTKAEPPSNMGIAPTTPLPGGQQASPGSDVGTSGTSPEMGGPAIKPTIMGAGPDRPAFTEEDVRKFIARYSGGFGRIQVESGTAHIENIEFLTVAVLQKKMADPLNLNMADQNLLCYVEYSGRFFVQAHPVIAQDGTAQNGPKFYYDHVGQVFDAHTGNSLMLTAFSSK